MLQRSLARLGRMFILKHLSCVLKGRENWQDPYSLLVEATWMAGASIGFASPQ